MTHLQPCATEVSARHAGGGRSGADRAKGPVKKEVTQ